MSTTFAGNQVETILLPVTKLYRDEAPRDKAPGDDTDRSGTYPAGIAGIDVDGVPVGTLAVVESVPAAPAEPALLDAPVVASGSDLDVPRPGEVETEVPAPRRRRWRTDLLVYAAFIALAAWVTNGLWPGAGHRVSAVDANDQAFFEWMLSHGARVVTHFDSPLFTDRMNVPTGINLMANTSILALSIPMTPVTLWFGPAVSFAMLITLGLAATAGSWYYVLSRHLVRSRSAALIGGAIAGFGPGIVAHANGHPNIVAQFLVPFIAWRTLRLREPGRILRNGLVLGLLIAVQVFINEEVLFIVALSLGLFIGAYAAIRRGAIKADIGPFLAGLGIAVAVASTLLAYPLWQQFFGPASYRGLNPDLQAYGADLASFTAFGTRTVIGKFTNNIHLAPNPAEQNAFLGWPLLITLGVAGYWLRRNVAAIALGITALVLAALSLGKTITINGEHTTVKGPWSLLSSLPIFDSVVPTRLSLFVLPAVAVIVALAHDHVTVSYGQDRLAKTAIRPKLAWGALLGVALATVIPTPVQTIRLAATPTFFTNGTWRRYVSPDQTVVPVPLPQQDNVAGLFWAASTDLAVQLPRGYFLGPDPSHDDQAIFGAPARQTTILLAKVIEKNRPAVIHAADRRAAIADLRYWHAGVVVQVPSGPAQHAVRETITDLLGFKPKWSGGVWVWDVRRLVNGTPTVLG